MEYKRNSIRSLFLFVLDIFFPDRCLSCGSRGQSICDGCVQKLRKAERETSRDIFACFDYRDPIIKKSIWRLKYHNRHSLGQRLGELLYKTTLEDIADMHMYTGGRPIVVIPVPLSAERRKIRGYNQAEHIARSFCDMGEHGIFELKSALVIKRKNTVPQAKIANRTKRLQNIRGAFTLTDPKFIKGRNIIIVDDVTTTGGTLTEIMDLMKKAGAKKVLGFAIAH